ncbi:MAG: SDR family NAD(P)-dependent oxidoreductase, partial [Deltaproteobacteria bacterium]
MSSFQGKNILITGASSGIGEALAREFSEQGANLVLMARRKEKLETIRSEIQTLNPQIKITLAVADVSQDESFRTALLEAIQEVGTLDVVVANAGFGVSGEVLKLSLEDYRRQFETNLMGVLRTIHGTAESLKKSRGRLAIIGSVNGYVSLPGISAYAMSKFAVRALCDALYHELKPFGVSVTHIAPGFVVSEIRKVNNRGELKTGARDPIPLWLQMKSAIAAQKIAKAIYRRKKERIVTGHGWW